jgi:WD40 repeat protein
MLVADVDLISCDPSPASKEKLYDVQSLVFAPDGRWIACGMGEHKEVVDPIIGVDTRTWTAFRVGEFPGRSNGNWHYPGGDFLVYSAVRKIIFTPDGRRLVTGADEGARVYDIEVSRRLAGDGGQVRLRHDGRVTGYDFHGDTKTGFPNTTINVILLPKARSKREASTLVLIAHEYGYLECIDIDDDRHGEHPMFVLFNDGPNAGPVNVSSDGRWVIHCGSKQIVPDLGDGPLEAAYL